METRPNSSAEDGYIVSSHGDAGSDARVPESLTLSSTPSTIIEEDQSYTCCFFWKPRWAQVFLSPIFFLICVCLVMFGDAVFLGTYGGIFTSIEIRYRLTAANLGILVTAYSLGNIVALPVVSYFGGRPRAARPRWIAMGTVVIAVGTLLIVLPQFLFGKYDAALSVGEVESLACMIDNEYDECSYFHHVGAQNNAAFWMMIVGTAISGVGYAAIPSLALSYIDDNCRLETTALYAGIMESMYGVGTMLGFFISSFSLTLWVDFYDLEPDTLLPSSEHPTWVGAWWIGLLICSLFFLLCCLPLFGFPLRLPRRVVKEGGVEPLGKGQKRPDEGEVDGEGDRKPGSGDLEDGPMKGLAKTWLRLIRNPVLMFITLGMVCDVAVSYGFATFFAKYLETQFEVTASLADLVTGVVLVPPYGIGWILGGLIVRKTKMGYRGMFVFAFCSLLLALASVILLFFFGCSNPLIAGVNVEYAGQSLSNISLVADCNMNCGCTTASYQPICDEINDVIYISPCYAGCNDTNDGLSYANCSCLGEHSDSAVAGLCEFDCNTLIPFLAVQVFQTLAITMAGVPQVMLLIRFVDAKDKTAALGINRLFTGLGGLVGPLVFAAFVDLSCLVWQDVCDQQGSCLVYDNNLFRNLFMGVSLAVGVVGLLCACPAYYFIRKAVYERPKGDPPVDEGEKEYIVLENTKKSDSNGN